MINVLKEITAVCERNYAPHKYIVWGKMNLVFLLAVHIPTTGK
jgi:hypothetical protein